MSRTSKSRAKPRVSTVTAVGVTIAALYFAQEVLIPLALAMLLAFLLAPLATRLERRGVNRIVSVLAVVVLAFGLILSLGWVVGRQVFSLAEQLPAYQDEIVRKVTRVKGTGGGLTDKIEKLSVEIEKAAVTPASRPASQPSSQPTTDTGAVKTAVAEVAGDPTRVIAREAVGAAPTTAPSTPGSTPANPLYTVNKEAPVSPIRTLFTYVGLVLGPLGTAGLVVVFVVFMLLEREALRDRLIRLVSSGKYTVTTRAINDAASRISKYMLAQSLVNGTYGLAIALGLWAIGATLGKGVTFPSFVLWGLLCGVLRFIPYIGPWVAAAFPVALSLAVYPGFGVFAGTLGLFVVIELISNNVMEPWLYGSSTGISTFAILVAAVFWTWLWGPIGLLLSTPLTVCIVVLGKYVSHLKFFDVLLGDQPALPPWVTFYQRLLAKDETAAAAIAQAHATAEGAERVPDDVVLPMLRVARRDRVDGDLSADDETHLIEATLRTLSLPQPPSAPPADAEAPPPSSDAPLVFGCTSHHKTEELTLALLAQSLEPRGVRVDWATTRALPAEIEQRVESETPAVVVIAVLPPGGVVQARYLCRRLRKRFPRLRIIVGYWGKTRRFDRLLARLRKAGASYVTTSIEQTRSQIQALLDVGPEAGQADDVTDPTVAKFR